MLAQVGRQRFQGGAMPDAAYLTGDEVHSLIRLAGGVRALARLLGIAPSTVSRWASGESACARHYQASAAHLAVMPHRERVS